VAWNRKQLNCQIVIPRIVCEEFVVNLFEKDFLDQKFNNSDIQPSEFRTVKLKRKNVIEECLEIVWYCNVGLETFQAYLDINS
jgi:hypothetical protein